MKREHDQNQQQQQPAAEVCNECKKAGTSEERWVLHSVRHKTYRRLCTHCVLNCFRGNFCPICLDVFDPIDSPPPTNQRVMCLSCPSISHLDCVTATSNSGGHPFQCSSCSNPNFSYFKLKQISSHKKLKLEESAISDGNHESRKGDVEYFRRAIDKESAKALVAAAKIASATMTKAAQTARVEADRRVKEAAFARKRAREALEKVAILSMKEKEREGKANRVGIVQEQHMRPRITSPVNLEGQNQSQGGEGGLGGHTTVVCSVVPPENGSNGSVSLLLPFASKNHPNNHHG